MTPVDIRAAAEALSRVCARFDACVARVELEAAELRRINDGLAAIVRRGRPAPANLPSSADHA